MKGISRLGGGGVERGLLPPLDILCPTLEVAILESDEMIHLFIKN